MEILKNNEKIKNEINYNLEESKYLDNKLMQLNAKKDRLLDNIG